MRFISDGPIAMRYPKGEGMDRSGRSIGPLSLRDAARSSGRGRMFCSSALGSMVAETAEVRERLKEQGISAGLVNVQICETLRPGISERLPLRGIDVS